MKNCAILLIALAAPPLIAADERGHMRRRGLKRGPKKGMKSSHTSTVADVFESGSNHSQMSMGMGMGMIGGSNTDNSDLPFSLTTPGANLSSNQPSNSRTPKTLDNIFENSGLKSRMDMGTGTMGGSNNGNAGNAKTLTLTIVNESFNQPFSPFFVMVHNSQAQRLYVRGQPSSSALATLAENGDPSSLVNLYNQNRNGVLSVAAFSEGAPYIGGDTFQMEVQVSREFPLVTIATMAINTNDGFTAINGMQLSPGMVLDVPGLDAGSEENNERCNSIPGPGCASISGSNVRSLNGEGFVHVHRGFFGIGDLPADRIDWRNPMMRIVVS